MAEMPRVALQWLPAWQEDSRTVSWSHKQLLTASDWLGQLSDVSFQTCLCKVRPPGLRRNHQVGFHQHFPFQLHDSMSLPGAGAFFEGQNPLW